MKIYLSIIFVFTFLQSIEAQMQQKVKLPAPVSCWGDLILNMPYPKLAIRAGINAKYKVEVIIDSLGGVKDINIINIPGFIGQDYIFLPTITNALKTIDWQAGTRNGISTVMEVSFILCFTSCSGADATYTYTDGSLYAEKSCIDFELSTKIKIYDIR